MAKKFSFLLAAALAVLILGIACDNGTGGKSDGSHTVTFLRNNDDPDSGPEKITVKVPDGETLGDRLPNDEYTAEEEGWDAGYRVTGWRTGTNNGTFLTARTKITEDWTVYAQWGYAESQRVEGDELIVIAPEITQGGNMHGTYNGTQNSNGSITWSSGGIRWAYPQASEDYDYVEIKYVGEGKDSAATIPSNILKQYDSTTDYVPETGSAFPTFNRTGTIKFKVKYGEAA